MNTPNKLTILRMVMIPFFLVFLMIPSIGHRYLWALVVFAAASVTDALDGHLARKNNLITNFGKFLDPLADKLLVVSALICFVGNDLISSLVVLVIIAREFLVTSIRLVAAGGGKVIAASIWGKIKTVTQIVAIIAVMFFEELRYINILPDGGYIFVIYEVLMWIATVFTLISGFQYLWANREFINTNK